MSNQLLRQCLERSISPRSAALYKRDLDYFWAWVKVAKKRNKDIYPVLAQKKLTSITPTI